MQIYRIVNAYKPSKNVYWIFCIKKNIANWNSFSSLKHFFLYLIEEDLFSNKHNSKYIIEMAAFDKSGITLCNKKAINVPKSKS